MKEFVEKLIGRLEEESYTATMLTESVRYLNLERTKTTINQLAEEYNNGWIPVSERLPDKSGKYLVTVKNLTGFWLLENDVFVCDFAYDTFIFQGWEDNDVIAWMPLPAPYQKGE